MNGVKCSNSVIQSPIRYTLCAKSKFFVEYPILFVSIQLIGSVQEARRLMIILPSQFVEITGLVYILYLTVPMQFPFPLHSFYLYCLCFFPECYICIKSLELKSVRKRITWCYHQYWVWVNRKHWLILKWSWGDILRSVHHDSLKMLGF